MSLTKHWHSAARTDLGKVRARNEDAYLNIAQHGLWAVADGMGGHHGGDIASRLIVDSLTQLSTAGDFEQRVEQVRQCLHWINRRLSQEMTLISESQGKVMGSTVVVLLVDGTRAVCIWAGDSRCYLWRGQHLYQLSRDHSLLQQLLDEQQLSIEQAQQHPSAHALTQAIGGDDRLGLDILEFSVQPGDVLLLCSDGLYQDISNKAVGQALSLSTAELALDRLFEGVLQGAARDNLTGVVIHL
ncbi:PP2C family protein-serine/threonine phosphatase [Pseudomonas sp. D47]|uniref:PP2C family protein-serine/threonine phosphatase n=1 Tax=Pseudomonas sp. D47 TaxID=3159447 RepID=UPI00387B78BF